MRRCGITQSKFLELTTGSCVRQVLQFQIDGIPARTDTSRVHPAFRLPNGLKLSGRAFQRSAPAACWPAVSAVERSRQLPVRRTNRRFPYAESSRYWNRSASRRRPRESR